MVKVIASLAAGPLPAQAVELCEEDGRAFVRGRGDLGFELPVDKFLTYARTVAEARERLRSGSYRTVEQLFAHLHDRGVLYVVLDHDDAGTRVELLVHQGHAALLDELWNRRPDGSVAALSPAGAPVTLDVVVRTPGDGVLPEAFAHAAIARRVGGRPYFALASQDAFLVRLYRTVVDRAAIGGDQALALVELARRAELALADVHDVAGHLVLLREHGFGDVEPRPALPLVAPPSTLRFAYESDGVISRVHVVERDGILAVRKQTTARHAPRGHALLARLTGDGFPRLLATEATSAYAVFELEHVDGYRLDDTARLASELSTAEAAELVRGCLDLVDALAQAGLRHGDVSAENILVRHGRPVLVDFDECAEGDAAEDLPALAVALAEAAALYPELLHVVDAMALPGVTVDELRALLDSGTPDAEAVAASAAVAAVRLISRGSLDLAAHAVGRSLELAPRSASLVAAAGTLALAHGRTLEAAEAFERALALESDCAEARKGLADLATDHGHIDEAADAYASLEPPASVTIVIPVFNRLDLTKQCLETLRQTTGEGLYEVVVVDNASTDGSTEFLRRERAAGRLKTVLNSSNLGFGRACNLAARLARGEYVLFLNNDTIPLAGWLEAMLETIADTTVGAVGSRLLYPDGTLQHAGIVFEDGKPEHAHRHFPADFGPALERRDYPAVTGACILFRRELLERLGGFDEAYQMYVEDVDLCLRVWDAGYRVVYEPESVLYHLESASVTDLARRDLQVRAGWKIMRERWDGRWPAALAGGAPVPDPPAERLDGARNTAVLAFAEELLADPSLLAAYAANVGPADDATLVIYAPDGADERLADVVAAAGLDDERCPDLMAVSGARSPETELRLAHAVDAVLSVRPPAAPFDRLPRYDAWAGRAAA